MVGDTANDRDTSCLGAAEPSPIGQMPIQPEFRLLYIFAGARRRADIGDWVSKLAGHYNITVVLVEIDICRDEADNLLDKERLEAIRADIAKGLYDAAFITPPCSTFSRATWANKMGPRPVRSAQWPQGFPWLSGEAKAVAHAGNELIRVALPLEC